MKTLLETMRRLRGPGGCPWDREQTHESLRPYLLEEAAEAVEALGALEPEAVCEELGDVLLQVAFHAVIAEEAGTFGYEDIERAIVAKLERRHPHVFGTLEVENAAEVVANWQAIKAKEKQDKAARQTAAPEDEPPRSLPALLRAQELGKRRSWEPPNPDAARAALEAFLAAPAPGALGGALLALAELGRAQGVNAELALRDALNERSSDHRRDPAPPSA